MICPHCGAHRQLTESIVGKIMANGQTGGKCPECNSHYTMTRDNAFDGDPEWIPITCKRCGCGQAERGLTICIGCWSMSQNKAKAKRMRAAVEKERTERASRKPGKLTLEQRAARAQAMGLTYGKYMMLKDMGKIKEE